MRALFPILALVALGCGPKAAFQGDPYQGQPPEIGLAPTVVAQDVLGGADQQDVFLKGMFVGNVLFKGGFTVVQANGGMQNRSKQIELSLQDTYRHQATGELDQWCADALKAHHDHWVSLKALPEGTLAPPDRALWRGTYDDQGVDNQNLPLFSLHPQPFAHAPPVPDGVELVLVPWLVSYYSHNAGWFQGQTWGTDAGARMRVLWALHDAKTGGVVAWGDQDARYIHTGLSSPNSAEVQEALMQVEGQMQKALRKHLP